MQSVAAEFNLSETAFVAPEGDRWRLRWFTPVAEVALCGHATLAAAHVLWSTGAPADQPLVFLTEQSGALTCRRTGQSITMEFPACPSTSTQAPEGLECALGARPVNVEQSAYDLLVELADENIVRSLNPNLQALAALPARGVIVTSRGSGGWDFVSRFFAPRVGVPEDPVTGSAHCTLGPYWAARIGGRRFRAWQASRRGGEVVLELTGGRVNLIGQAVTVWEGVLR